MAGQSAKRVFQAELPAIHVFPFAAAKDVDGRVKPGHDAFLL
jgi:hypothetical protein